jgi:Uma2 family endonuclease
MNAELLKVLEKLDLPFPWETNAQGQIIMTPVDYDHSNRVMRLDRLLARIAPDWNTGAELGIETRDGIKAPDLVIASAEYDARHRGKPGYATEAPEICVEIMSRSNSWPEMREKMRLYFEVGAREVWIVDTDGRISFFAPGSEAMEGSQLIVEMPGSI